MKVAAKVEGVEEAAAKAEEAAAKDEEAAEQDEVQASPLEEASHLEAALSSVEASLHADSNHQPLLEVIAAFASPRVESTEELCQLPQSCLTLIPGHLPGGAGGQRRQRGRGSS